MQVSELEGVMFLVPVVKPEVRLETVYPSSIPVEGVEVEEVVALK